MKPVPPRMLTSRADFYTVLTTPNGLGQEVRSRVLLYGAVPCQAKDLSAKKNWNPDITDEMHYDSGIRLLVAPEFDGADRGDQVDLSGITYTITRSYGVADQHNATHHTYILEENI